MDQYWKVGDRAFAYWEEDDYYYPATLTEIVEEDIRVRFDDSDEEEWTNSAYLAEYSVLPGDAVEGFWEEDGEYYTGEVLAVKGEDVLIAFDEDGSEVWTTLSALRMWYEDEEEDEEEY